MSSSNPKRNWFSTIFSSLTPSDIPSSTCSLHLSDSLIKKSASKLSESIKTSDQDSIRFAGNLTEKNRSVSKFISLQRLDSVGGVDSEPNRFSYPPSKGETDSYLMGNIMQSSWLRKGLPESHHSSALPTKANSQTFLGNSFSQFGDYLVSTLHHLSEKVSTSILHPTVLQTGTGTCASNLVRRETTFPVSDSQTVSEPDPHIKLVKLSSDVKRVSSYTVTCVKDSFAASNAKKLGSYQSDSMYAFSKSSSIDTSVTNPESDNSYLENKPSMQVSNGHLLCAKSQNLALNTQCVCAESLCTSDTAENDQCKIVFPTSSSMHFSDGDVCADYRSATCSDDRCSETSFSSLESVDNFSEHSATTDDEWSESECDFIDSTDSENRFCQWERLTSYRTPWTCGQNRKQSSSRIMNNQSPLPHSTSEESIEFEANPIKKQKFREGLDFQFHPVDDCQLKGEVSRPLCLNSDISFILGWPAENGYDSDNEDSISWCSESVESNLIGDKTSCCSSNQCEADVGGSSTSQNNNSSSTSQNNNSCRLWDYFANQQNPLSNIASTISDYCPTSPRKDKESKKFQIPSEKNTTNDQTQPEKIFYKAPSKVRFADKVVVHPMFTWSFAYRQARKGCWHLMALDRDRFKCRIASVEKEIAWCLKPFHRQKIRQLIGT